MNKIFYYILIAFLYTSCSPNMYTVHIKNPSSFDRSTEMLEFPLTKIKGKIPLSATEAYVVKNEQGEELPSQVTYNGKLIFQVDFKAHQKQKFSIAKGQVKAYTPLVGGRFYSERKDDFAWENDKVGFRFYGNALNIAEGPSNGLDLWYKRTSELILDKWYKNDIAKVASYHVDHGEGCDPYGVKRSLGGGAMAPFVGDSLWQNTNHVAYEVLDNGPLRITAKLTYPDIVVGEKSFADTRVVSLDAGSQLTKITQTFGTTEDITVAAGIVKRQANDSVIISKENSYTIYQEPYTERNGQIYLGVLIPQGINSVIINSYEYLNIYKKMEKYTHVLSLTNYQPNIPITYYTGFGWTKFGFPDMQSFEKYMTDFSRKIKEPLLIK